jgi:GTPase SAR1 family protein
MNVFLGSHGVGKSTLLNRLRLERPDLYITDGFSRPIKIALRRFENIDLYKEQSILNELTEWIWIQNLNSDIYTCTRSVIDSYIYSKCLGFDDLAKKSLNVFLNSQPKSIRYFYIPIEFEIEDDGLRYTDVIFQKQIDSEIFRFIEKYNLDIINLSGSVDERLSKLKINL